MRELSRFFIVCAAVIIGGCATVPDPDPPDLSSSKDAAEARRESAFAAERSVLADLERLDEAYESLQLMTARTTSGGVPVSLLRLVTMNCLNTEYGDGVSQVVELNNTTLTCRPAHIDQLQTALDEVPIADRDEALELLYLVDQVRILRGSLRQRLARLPRTITEHRDFIIEERAMLRQLEADLARRRTLYSAQGWREVAQLIADHRVLLREFDEHLDELEQDFPAWPTRVDDLISQIYFDLSDMRAN